MRWLSPLAIPALLCAGGSIVSYLTFRAIAYRVVGLQAVGYLAWLGISNFVYSLLVVFRYSTDNIGLAQFFYSSGNALLVAQILVVVVLVRELVGLSKQEWWASIFFAALTALCIAHHLFLGAPMGMYLLLDTYLTFEPHPSSSLQIAALAVLLLWLYIAIRIFRAQDTQLARKTFLLGFAVYFGAVIAEWTSAGISTNSPNLVVFGQLFLALAVQRAISNQLTTQFDRVDATNRLRAKMMDKMSHELRTPLGVIHGYLDMLSNGILGELSQQQHNAISISLENVQAETEIVDDLLLSSYLEQGVNLHKSSVDINAIVAQIVTKLERNYASLGMTVALESENIPALYADETLLRKAITKIIDNAFSHTAPETTIKISVAATTEEIIISVTDQGPGLNDDTTVLLEAFAQSGEHADVSKGMGLGLQIASALVQLHDGQLTLANREKEQGAVVEIRLPLTSEEN